MNRLTPIAVLFVVTVVCSGIGAGYGPSLSASGTTDTTAEEVSVVIVFENQSARQTASFGEHVTVTGGHDVAFMPVLFADVPSDTVAALDARTDIAAVYRDSTVSLPDNRETTAPVTDAAVDSSGQQVPWGIERVEARDARQSVGDTSEVTVAVLDTGVDYTHPDLDSTVSWGANFSNGVTEYGLSTAMDNDGHGTLAAGVIAAEDNGEGVVGAAPGVNLYSIKVLDDQGEGTYSWLISGIDAALKGEDRTLGTADDADVLSISLGGPSMSDTLGDAVSSASEHALVVSAAGNNGDGDVTTNNVSYPAKYPGSIAVAATDSTDETATFSAEGDEVELAAPGVNVETTTLGGGTAGFSGTSAATPHISGIAALVVASDLADGQRDLGPADIRTRLQEAAVDIESAGIDRRSGYGLPLATAAVDEVTAPASFAVSDLLPGETTVTQGETFDASATVENTGGEAGTQTVALTFDGSVAVDRSVSLDPGETRTVLFEDVATDSLGSGTYAYEITTANDSQMSTLTVEEPLVPATFQVSNLSPSSHTATSGAVVGVNATIANAGDVAATKDVEFRFDGDVIDTGSISLEGGANTTVAFSLDTTGYDPGQHTYAIQTTNDSLSGTLTIEAPSAFAVRSLQLANATVAPGESLAVSATIENIGGAGAGTVSLSVANETRRNKTISLARDEQRTVAFDDVTTETLESGAHNISVSGSHSSRTEQFVVRRPTLEATMPLDLIPGRNGTLSYTVTNNRDSVATNVSLTVDTPQNVTVFGSSEQSFAGELAPGESKTTNVTVMPVETYGGDVVPIGATATIDGEQFTRTDSVDISRTAVAVRGSETIETTPGSSVTVPLNYSNIGLSRPGIGRLQVESISDPLTVSSTTVHWFGIGTPVPAPGNTTERVFEVQVPENASGNYTLVANGTLETVAGSLTVAAFDTETVTIVVRDDVWYRPYVDESGTVGAPGLNAAVTAYLQGSLAANRLNTVIQSYLSGNQISSVQT